MFFPPLSILSADPLPSQHHRFVVGLGTSIPGGRLVMDRLVDRMKEDPDFDLLGCSSFHTTLPEGGQTFQLFCNAAIVIQTRLHAYACLMRLQSYEQQYGRLRFKKNGDRCLDLDILLADRLTIQTKRFQIPHRAFLHRSFALIPAIEALRAASLQIPEPLLLAARQCRHGARP